MGSGTRISGRGPKGTPGAPARTCPGGALDARTVERLIAINRAFYRDSAGSFSDARRQPWPGWERVWERVRREIAPGALSVLDVGCGHGRFAAFLDAKAAALGERFAYLGVDASEPLLEMARARRYAACEPELRVSDPVSEGPEVALPPGPFALVALFGFLHHVPSAELRRRLLAALAARVAPGGLLALTSWEFEHFARFRERLLPWKEWNRRTREPVDLAQLEPGDHLLLWGDGGKAVRYCHLSEAAEVGAVIESLGLEHVAGWLADGHEGRRNRYFLLRHRG